MNFDKYEKWIWIAAIISIVLKVSFLVIIIIMSINYLEDKFPNTRLGKTINYYLEDIRK